LNTLLGSPTFVYSTQNQSIDKKLISKNLIYNGAINDYIMIARKNNESCGLRADFAYTLLNALEITDAEETKY